MGKSLTYYCHRPILTSMKFQWDDTKDLGNQKKHGLSFSESKYLFESGQDYLEIHDTENSFGEDRFIAIGEIQRGIILVVFTERGDEDTIRIIGARFATKREQQLYNRYMDRD